MVKIVSLEFPLFVKWYITSRCNLRCKHCYLTDYTEKGSLHKILEIADYLGYRRVANVVLLGGEPLTRDDLEIIVARLRSYGIGIKIATNGILATSTRAERLVQHGARNFQVSLEGHSPELSDPTRGDGTFEKIIAGVKALKDAGAYVSFALTITAKNHHLVEEFVEFSSATKIDELKFNAFVPIGTGALLQRDHFLNREIAKEVAERILVARKNYPNLKINPGAFVSRVTFHRQPQESSSVGCGAGTTSLIINSDFTLSACDMLIEEHRTIQSIQDPQSIAEIWHTDPVFQQWRGNGNKEDRTATIRSFMNVHQEGCHAAFNAYRKNIF